MSMTIRKTLYGAEIVGQKILHENGSFRRVRYWLRGKVYGIQNLTKKYVEGWSGIETQVDVDEIFPSKIFDVKGVSS